MDTQQFPPHLAFGKLNENSIHSEENFKIADYYLLGEKVMEIKLSADNMQLTEFFQGESLASTWHRDLKAGFMQHFSLTDTSQNPVIDFLARQVCNLGNVYFQKMIDDPNNPKIIFYPAAYLFIIRVPVTENTTETIDAALLSTFLYEKVSDLYDSKIIIEWKNGNRQEKEIMIMEIVVPAAFLYETIQWLTERNLILKEKLFRAIVQEGANKGFVSVGNMFSGTEEDAWNSYTIQYKPLLANTDKE